MELHFCLYVLGFRCPFIFDFQNDKNLRTTFELASEVTVPLFPSNRLVPLALWLVNIECYWSKLILGIYLIGREINNKENAYWRNTYISFHSLDEVNKACQFILLKQVFHITKCMGKYLTNEGRKGMMLTNTNFRNKGEPICSGGPLGPSHRIIDNQSYKETKIYKKMRVFGCLKSCSGLINKLFCTKILMFGELSETYYCIANGLVWFANLVCNHIVSIV